ncbi:MAG: hypothetical protein IV108_00560 [Burkholderiales bacterium]|nr:hypothetical protein [Burkholderiales bacterium]
MDFGYYTFPGLLIAIATFLYGWQEPRMKKLEKGRKKQLETMLASFFDAGTIETAKAKVHTFLNNAYVNHKDLLMPIRMFLPYRRIAWCLASAMFLATVCALWSSYLKQFYLINQPQFSFSVNDLLTTAIVFLSALPTKWVFDEFRYMRRIIDRFDGDDDQ